MLNAGPSKERQAILATSDDFSKTDVLLFYHGQAIQRSVFQRFFKSSQQGRTAIQQSAFFFTQNRGYYKLIL